MFTKLGFEAITEIVWNGVRIHRPAGTFSFRPHTFIDSNENAWVVPALVAHGGPEPIYLDYPTPIRLFAVSKGSTAPGVPQCYAWYEGDDLGGLHRRGDNSAILLSDPTQFHNAGLLTHDFTPRFVRVALNVLTEPNGQVFDNTGIFGNIGWL